MSHLILYMNSIALSQFFVYHEHSHFYFLTPNKWWIKELTCQAEFVEQGHDGGAGLEGVGNQGGLEARLNPYSDIFTSPSHREGLDFSDHLADIENNKQTNK